MGDMIFCGTFSLNEHGILKCKLGKRQFGHHEPIRVASLPMNYTALDSDPTTKVTLNHWRDLHRPPDNWNCASVSVDSKIGLPGGQAGRLHRDKWRRAWNLNKGFMFRSSRLLVAHCRRYQWTIPASSLRQYCTCTPHFRCTHTYPGRLPLHIIKTPLHSECIGAFVGERLGMWHLGQDRRVGMSRVNKGFWHNTSCYVS